MKKLTKQQLKALNNLHYELDELDNKPRKLYYALEKFASAFGKDDYKKLFISLKDFTIKVKKWQIKNSPDELNNPEIEIQRVRDFIKEHIYYLSKYKFN